MEVLSIVLIIGIIPAMIASSKGRSFFLWYIYGVLFFIIALVHSILISKNSELVSAELSYGKKNVLNALSGYRQMLWFAGIAKKYSLSL